MTSSGGYVALGFTEDPTDLVGELLAVKTGADELVGACSQVRTATPLDLLDPGLATIAPALRLQATTGAQADSPSATHATSISGTSGQC